MKKNTNNKKINDIINDLISRYPILKTIQQDIIGAFYLLEKCYENNGKLLIAGNGGSAADAEHISGELMKGFKKTRPISDTLKKELIRIDSIQGRRLAKSLQESLTAIPLVSHEALTTAYINDVDAIGVFAQQLLGFGQEKDAFLAISTSGNSHNILAAALVAKAIGMKVIGLTGATGGKLADYCDVCIRVPAKKTYMIQELHLPVYHCICMMLEERFFTK